MDELVLGLHLGEGMCYLAWSLPWKTLRTLRCNLCRACFPNSSVARDHYLLWNLLTLQPNKMKNSSCLAVFPVPSRGASAAGTQHPGINFDLCPTSLLGQLLLSISRHCYSGSVFSLPPAPSLRQPPDWDLTPFFSSSS